MVRQLSLSLTLLLAFAAGCKTTEPEGPDMSASGGTISCVTAATCPANLPMCHPDSKICVGCIESFQTCGDKLTCDQATHTCVPLDPSARCRRNSDCPRMGFDDPKSTTCEPDAGVCVGCVIDFDCVSPDVCNPTMRVCGDFCAIECAGKVCDRANRLCLEPLDAGTD